MAEPIHPPVATPIGGWPKLAHRVEFVGVKTLDEAIYELCGISRRTHLGYVAQFEGHDLYVYPHQHTRQVRDAFVRVRDLEAAGVITAPGPGDVRWTVKRKNWIVIAVAEGHLSHEDAIGVWNITPEELASWQARFRQHGPPGLAALSVQQLRTAPAGGETAHG